MIQKIQHYLYHSKAPWFILVMTFASFLLPMPTSFLPGGIQKNPIEDENLSVQIVDGIVIAPLIETALYQMFVFWILRLIPGMETYNKSIIFISACIFGLSHSFGYTYMLHAGIMGLVFAYSYWNYTQKKENGILKFQMNE
ncbi:CPBP family intramembrane glutamic endopeptidase [Bacillus cereus group sp. Bc253]|uniref:CPBP family intramembrane glutamic endopeptidase n=1 Tax=Bacillus cereus group sp. Bc253 TaxID=3018103 RepID=UPI0022E16416|nr:CPBP family intramembrane glutamic endopeptidase [Bacillus cereus group sp. Bc253]MDA2157702.1 CPBP family intramembrane metalloprotease [Bacillus cereus group sp. Bc253]